MISDGHYLPMAELLGDPNFEVVDKGGIRYYVVKDEEGNPLQAAFIGERNGFNAPVRFLLVLDEEHKVRQVKVLQQDENQGFGELITRANFLNQFVGLDKDSSFAAPNVQVISGATISSMAVISGVSRALDEFDVAFFSEEVGGWNDGTYTGRADSFGGPLEVEVVVKERKIVSVTVLSHSDF